MLHQYLGDILCIAKHLPTCLANDGGTLTDHSQDLKRLKYSKYGGHPFALHQHIGTNIQDIRNISNLNKFKTQHKFKTQLKASLFKTA